MIDTIRELTTVSIYELLSGYMVGKHEASDRWLDEVEPYRGEYRLDPGTYLIQFEEGVPIGRYAHIYPSRELIYSGGTLMGPGLQTGDEVEGLLYCDSSTRIEVGATLGEIWTIKTKDWSA